MTWSQTDLATFAPADDFRVAPFRADGKTPGTPTFIWSVVSDGRLFIRPYSGARSSWYQAALEQGAGQVQIAGATRDVRFAPAPDDDLNDRIDDAYREKYAGSRYLVPMVADCPRAATVEVLPAA
ncbi:MAG: DUF2255 family protein [Pseudomonadota bacterium]|nr:DUF2255 family protein [Pseudomonadota bacterium]